ncbi:MAG: PEP-CTERM sorting domain-containing protein [Halodesulfovibrio sp.]
MKRFFSIVAAAILSLALTAPAFADKITDWTFDLSNVITGYDSDDNPIYGPTYTGVDSLIVAGTANIHQELGDDFMLSNGDDFTVAAYLGTVKIDFGGGVLSNIADGNGEFFFYGTDLGGSVYGVESTGSPDTGFYGAAKFMYQYTSGTIGLYYGDKDNIGSSTLLNTLEIDNSDSTPTLANQGGQYLSGDLDLITHFTDTGVNSVFFTEILGNIVQYYFDSLSTQVQLIFDLQNNLSIAEGTIHETLDGEGNVTGFDAVAYSGGNVSLAVTPEPSTFLIFGLGLLGLLGFRRKLAK